jgi:hypothetical protein
MKLHALVRAISDGDLIQAREWVADSKRCRLVWESLERPVELNDRELTIAAALVELLAARDGAVAPLWTASIGGQTELMILDPGLDEMPRSFERAKASCPEPLRKRNLLALPEFLQIA